MLRTLKQILRTGIISESRISHQDDSGPVSKLQAQLHRRFGRALAVRHVDAGSCNGCELEIHAVTNPYYNLEGYGIRFVASPRHADVLLVTGPVSRHMETALKQAYDAMPDPKWVIAVGNCACTGGLFGLGYASCGPVARVLPVDQVVSGCPPPPDAILHALVAVVTTSHK